MRQVKKLPNARSARRFDWRWLRPWRVTAHSAGLGWSVPGSSVTPIPGLERRCLQGWPAFVDLMVSRGLCAFGTLECFGICRGYFVPSSGKASNQRSGVGLRSTWSLLSKALRPMKVHGVSLRRCISIPPNGDGSSESAQSTLHLPAPGSGICSPRRGTPRRALADDLRGVRVPVAARWSGLCCLRPDKPRPLL